ncbi:PAS domain-containing sensor histidine kinase [Aurantimonas sp. Leaf443]|uniref:sensor histidine kinase n=1 Tax=Aurantimonas sp. Leaf443 TaxID=1736378 RepID=UPI0006F9CFFC|nr:PAS domain-containing sensor histidine kinase [Aurantimonas sp. Leaf443]KQT83974.1 histidine kinase [Aurantimonas sp. Leaf443]
MNEADRSGGASARRTRRSHGAAAARASRRPAPWRGAPGGACAAGTATVALALAVSAGPAAAQSASPFALMTPTDIVYLALLAMLVGTAMLTTVFLMRQRALTVAEADRLRLELSEARAEADKRAALMAAEDERLVIYSGSARPEIVGQLDCAGRVPADERGFLAFSDWMDGASAQGLAEAVVALRERAEPFSQVVDLGEAGLIEVRGRTVGGLAVLRFTQLAGLRERLSELEIENERALATIETMQNLFDAAPIPVWLRDGERRLVWINEAYARAVDARSASEALTRQVEFLTEQDRQASAARLRAGGRFDEKISTVVAADRRNFRVVESAGPLGSAGLAIDVSETEQVRMELRQTIDSQSETLDQLTTAVARFDQKTRLVYHNAAFQRLFNLTNAYLEADPDHLSLLDHLRTQGTLPTENYFQSELHQKDLAAYRATEPTETMWHLTDGRTLRVIATPQPQGGATWVFEDITEKLELESQVRATIRLQRETIDYLSEAVAVFGGDGRLRLSNPSFAELWGFDGEYLQTRPRIHTLPGFARVEMLPSPDGQGAGWQGFCEAVTAFDEDGRETQTGEVALSDGRILAYGAVPLPNGQTMLTFSDVSDARVAQRMLLERNEALEQANQIKNDFVQHVNYELRSPLTNIIGFSALLRSPETGPLTPRQSQYLDYIATSTSALLTIVNDILDLATVDAGIMELDLADVDIARTVEHAADGIRDRLAEHEIALRIDISGAGETMRADGHRLIQVLFNLLSNAANFAPSGSTVDLVARREGEDVVFSVTDRGPGIPEDQIGRIFERFEANPVGGRQSGAGLGLSIVKSFVELHQGEVAIRTAKGGGTTVVCRLPAGGAKPTGGTPHHHPYLEHAAE